MNMNMSRKSKRKK